MQADTVPVRDASTIVLIRKDGTAPRVLMGQRGAKAVFMPSKYVFPGGAVDPQDREVSPGLPLRAEDRARLEVPPSDASANALAAAAIRELWEETGLVLGAPSENRPSGADWQAFAARGVAPNFAALSFFFRAITPPGRPRRFDARFFIADASQISGEIDDFSAASEELSHLHWISLHDARGLDLPFITEIVLAEVAKRLARPDAAHRVPFFNHHGEVSHFSML